MGRYRRYIIAAAIVVVLIGAYAAAGFLAVPYLARRAAVDFVRTHYGRTLAVGEIRFNPFTLDLDITRLSLPDADGQTLLAFDRLHVDVALASLWHLAPDFREILLEQPYVRVVVRPDGALNLADLGKGFPPAPKPVKPAAPMRLIIHRLAVVNGSTTFEDRTHATSFRAELKPIAFELHDFSTTGDTGNDYALNAASPQGERLVWSGTVQLAPLASRGQFEIADLRARTMWCYLRASLPFEIDSGVIGIKGDYQLGSGTGPLALNVDVHDTTVTDLKVKPRSGTEDYVALKRIEVRETRLDLGAHRVEVARVQLSGGDIKAWMSEQGRLNLLDLVTPPSATQGDPAPPAGAPGPAAAAKAPAAPAASAAWMVAVPDIGIQGFRIAAEDRRMKPAAALVVDPLEIHVAGFNTSPGDTLDVTLDAVVNSSGKLAVKAKVTPATASLAAHIEAAHLPLPALQPYLTRYTSMTLRQGELGLKFDVERRADGSLDARGDTVIRNLSTVDNALKQDFIKWKELRLADLRFRSQPTSLHVGSVTAVEPYVRMIVEPDQTTNIRKILTPPGSSTAGSATAAAPNATPAASDGRAAATRVAAAAKPAAPLTPLPVAIGAVRVANGAANYTDLWIKPSFTLNMQELNGTITGLSSDPASRAKVQLKGSIERYSPVSIAGEVNLLSAALYTDITIGVKDLDLTIVNPYSGHFAGYRINKGKLTVDVSYKVEQRKLTAAQHFVIDQLELGERVDSPDAVHLPLKIAVALLRDRNGVIDLNLPMTGSLDDPHFSIWPLVWKVLVNVIVKAATAPFALLGHLVGGGEHMNVVEFASGSAALDKAAQDQLAALAKALQQRPQLKLDVPIVSSKALDGAQLARAHLRQELLARVAGTREGKRHPDTAGEVALADPPQHFKLLIEQFHADLGKDAALPSSAVAVEAAKRKETPPYDAAISELDAALLAHLQPGQGDLDALGKERAQAIQSALLTGGQIDPGRVFIVNAAPKPDAGDKVKVELTIK
jgi:hypothetical protein